MYVEKTTSEERGIIASKVEGLIIQFDTCQTLLQDIVENGFEFESGEATECKIDPELLCDRLWIISNLMFDTVLQYHLMMVMGNMVLFKPILKELTPLERRLRWKTHGDKSTDGNWR